MLPNGSIRFLIPITTPFFFVIISYGLLAKVKHMHASAAPNKPGLYPPKPR